MSYRSIANQPPPVPLPASHAVTVSSARPMNQTVEQQVLTLEWHISNLRSIFESTKDNFKSRCIKSPLFGGGRWQVYFYPCSGPEGFISLYLACEPTPEERAKGLQQQQQQQSSSAPTSVSQTGSPARPSNPASQAGLLSTQDLGGPWAREGVFNFSFELRSPDRQLFKIIEANAHSFSHEARNWGWSQFQSRNSTFFNNPKAKADDAIVIVCSITHPPQAPQSFSPNPPKRQIPNELIQAYASLFNDRDHSDVVFYIKPSTPGARMRKLYAIKKILALRSEYFAAMFDGWNEEHSDCDVSDDESIASDEDEGVFSDMGSEYGNTTVDEGETQEPAEVLPHEQPMSSTLDANLTDLNESLGNVELDDEQIEARDSGHSSTSSLTDAVSAMASPARTSRPATTANSPVASRHLASSIRARPTHRKTKVVITDASYQAFKALLYYLYTDTVHFLPLSSSFLVAKEAATSKNQPFPYSTKQEWFTAINPNNAPAGIEPLVKSDSNQVLMTSAKEVYTLADKLLLVDLRARAGMHIQRSLTVSTIALEIFSPFTTKFPEIQAYQKAFLLRNWRDVRRSGTLKAVFEMIAEEGAARRYPGFTDVWTSLLPFLEFSASELRDEGDLVL